jgi:tetratricopeptide (TPR) repeat protein
MVGESAPSANRPDDLDGEPSHTRSFGTLKAAFSARRYNFGHAALRERPTHSRICSPTWTPERDSRRLIQTVRVMIGRENETRWSIGTLTRGSKPQLNRREVLASADKFRLRGKYKKAIAEYRRLIAEDAADADAHSKIAQLLVKLRKRDEALKSFRAAAEGFVARGFVDRAIAMYSQAAAAFPEEPFLWEQLGRLNYERGRRAEGVKALIVGASHLTRRKRSEAAKLLVHALKYEPLHVDATLALCGILKKDGRKPEAKKLLEELTKEIRGPAQARVRAAELKLFPGLSSFFRWVRA